MKKIYRLTSGFDIEITLEIDTGKLPVDEACELNNFFAGSAELLRKSGGDVYQAVARRLAGPLICGLISGLTEDGAIHEFTGGEGWGERLDWVRIVEYEIPDLSEEGFDAEGRRANNEYESYLVTDKFQPLRDELPELADIAEKIVALNPRPQLIIDLLAEHDRLAAIVRASEACRLGKDIPFSSNELDYSSLVRLDENMRNLINYIAEEWEYGCETRLGKLTVELSDMRGTIFALLAEQEVEEGES